MSNTKKLNKEEKIEKAHKLLKQVHPLLKEVDELELTEDDLKEISATGTGMLKGPDGHNQPGLPQLIFDIIKYFT